MKAKERYLNLLSDGDVKFRYMIPYRGQLKKGSFGYVLETKV